MAERHGKYHSTRYSKTSSRRRSKDDNKCRPYESKTPPLPHRRTSIQELMKERETIRKELKHIAKLKTETQKEIRENYKKRKCEKPNDQTNNEKHHRDYIKNKKPKNDVTVKKTSPENSQDYAQLDSEDEEHIIEQRRQQRKQLLEQLHTSVEKTDNTSCEENANNEIKDLHSNKSQKSLTINQTKSAKDVTDMFSEEDFVPKNDTDNVTQDNRKESSKLNDNWDDVEGYYNIKVGDIINNNQYTIKALLGQGVFANVVKAQDSNNSNEVAIKIVRNNDLMYKTGLKEVEVLKEINDADPESKYHCVKFYSNFMHKGHLCLVLEPLHMDLRSILKKYGRHHGINIKALMSYSRQLILSLRLLKKIGIIHADIKPDNILVNEKKNILKLCDFGSATKINDNEPTPYLVSRFYRAPEIILGIPYKHGVDVWSTACTIYEMSTGKILFTGSSNNKMLKCFMDLKGKIPSRVVRKGKFKDQHFNYNNNFLLHKKDEFTGREKVVEITNITMSRDLYKELKKSSLNPPTGEEKKIIQLKDLLEKMLILDSNQRLSVTDCLKHPFIQDELQK
ncbi:serine/threonine-protein kinase PRP4 homolog [Vanessa tameamea]|uniref:non-specific serine/threonine protein kinase n=1 Tax=Vanessa tameamea TaxID=334116 RepID=A0A8B8ID31_VANTA|nr:serine/threonine-protein kinase PRP4 homolog [Vanessa tameamea]XP_026494111.1 serine/threonine-protein kinase PRP4 homolog [Vanessa tameamea]XP_026494119.1 serine/threonine-protein kinase PRP4 homolog [Vanessa tameamea]XP_026494127.1 serine/threonine-protein kinase PRP4 homolog [Vanessa tameamea]XP_026494135.1 serine/threonine-protein kinase PRP4 homolog [Vanessa tameamea]XP_026494142.1 serine/threonine-protein kinase PRP4 homolog [Vanessa tameamea]XP_026494150.1 serine/threonine-protein k